MLLGLSGFAGCGKTTAANYLKEVYGFVEVSYADPLKDAVCALLDIDRATLEELKENQTPVPDIDKTMRNLLQTLGTEWGRNMVHQDLWTILAQRKINKLQRESKNKCQPLAVIISDVRFINEAQAILSNGGELVYIVGMSDLTESRLDSVQQKHESEAHQKKLKVMANYTIDNTRTMQDLFNQLDHLIIQVLQKPQGKSNQSTFDLKSKTDMVAKATRSLVLRSIGSMPNLEGNITDS